jgi:DNA polymerase-3 subunit alpha
MKLVLAIQRHSAQAEVELGEDARFYPSDEALQRWLAACQGRARVVYDLTASET